MNLHNHRAIVLVITAVLALLVASPALQRVIIYPRTEFFSELWILGPEHKAENYPSNITRNANYQVFLGVGNQLGRSAYYQIQVKFRNPKQSAPNSTELKPSNLSSLYTINSVVADLQAWEFPLTFSLDYTQDQSDNYTMHFHSLGFNGNALTLPDVSTTWDKEGDGFFVNLFFELWIYDDSTGSFHYHERFTDLWFNAKL